MDCAPCVHTIIEVDNMVTTTIKKEKIPSYEEYVEKHGDLINVEDFRSKLNMTREFLIELIEKGIIPEEKVARVGVDIMPKKGASTAGHYFHKNWAENFKREDVGYTLKEISKLLGINYGWLRDVSSNKQELIADARISRYFWNIDWFKENLSDLYEKTYSQRGQVRKSEFYDLLSEEQQQWIEGYLKRRVDGEGIRVGRKLEWSKKPAKPEKTIEQWRKDLSKIFYKIICGRAGIEKYYELERAGKYKDLTEVEKELFEKEKEYFLVTDFRPGDIAKIKIGYKDTTFAALVESVLTPFLYYVLNKLKEDWVELKQEFKSRRADISKDDVDNAKEIYEDFEISLETSLSKTPPKRIETAEEDERLSVFLNHEQILLAKNVLRDADFHAPMKRTIVFMFGSLVGIRPDEFAHLKIENFKLDPETKLLKRYKFDFEIEDFVELKPDHPEYHNGYGRCWIVYNKGGYSKSHPILGTLIVPRLANYINLYLENVLYKKNPSSRGYGFLIRPRVQLPIRPYSAQGIARWLSGFSTEEFSFLSDEPVDQAFPDKTPRRSFKYYDSRHTVYNLIIKTNVSELDDKIKERAAQIHARHDVKMKQGNTGRTNYTEEISIKDYYTAIDKTINFPWDLGDNQDGEFYNWADNVGLRFRKTEVIDEPLILEEPLIEAEMTEEEQKELKELQKELIKNENLANKLANGPSGDYKDTDKWVGKTVELDKKIKQIKKKIQTLTLG
jgi:hypothetical protein